MPLTCPEAYFQQPIWWSGSIADHTRSIRRPGTWKMSFITSEFRGRGHFDRPVDLFSSQFGYQIVEQNLVRKPVNGGTSFLSMWSFPTPSKIVMCQVSVFGLSELASNLLPRLIRCGSCSVPRSISTELPPYVEVTDRNSVIVHFFSVTDQSIARREDFLSHSLEWPGRCYLDGPQTPFELEYLKAVELIRSAQRQPDTLKGKRQPLHEALRKSSMQAENDAQITQALKQRDVLLKVLPEMIISNSQMTSSLFSNPASRWRRIIENNSIPTQLRP